MSNTKITSLTNELINGEKSIHRLLSDLDIALLNMRISEARIGGTEGKALEVTTNYLENIFKKLDKAVIRVSEIANEIDAENK